MYRISAICLIVGSALLVTSCSKDDSPTGYAMTPPDTLWTQTYDIGFAKGVLQTQDGGFVLFGSATPTAGNYIPWMMKTDANGDSLWSAYYEADEPVFIRGMAPTPDGGFILTGQHGLLYNSSDIILLKVDPSGLEQWRKIFASGDSAGTGANDIAVTPEGDFIILATYTYTPEFLDFHATWLLKTDVYGDSIWCKSYAGIWGNSIQSTADGGYIIGGSTVTPYLQYLNIEDFCLIRTDANGDSLWSQIVAMGENDYGGCVRQTYDGGFILTGYTMDFLEYMDICVLKTDYFGELVWQNTFQEGVLNEALCIEQTSDHGYVIAGNTGEDWFANGPPDIPILIKLNMVGFEQWRKIIDGGTIYDMAITTDGGYVLAGYSEGDAWLVRLASE